MSESHIGRKGALVARLISVSMEIDDDDRDVINVLVEVSNEASIPMGQLEPLIETSEGTSFTPTDAITSIGPGLSRTYQFNFSIMGGEWSFRLWHSSAGGRRSVDIGPHHSEFTLQKADPTRTPKSSMGEGLFGGAFDLGMDIFGSTSERELIDSRHIELVGYEAEHDEGGSTRINVLDDESTAPLSAPIEPIAPIEPLTPLYAPTGPPKPLATQAPIASPQAPPTGPPEPLVAAPPLEMPTGPPQAPPVAPPIESPMAPLQTPPAGPPAAPPQTPLQAPVAPPSSPPAGSPSNDPMAMIMAQTNSQAPPTGPPQEAPTNSPTGPPDGPPSAPPAGPPQEAPTNSPTGPPGGPPSAPPSGPPSAPPQN